MTMIDCSLHNKTSNKTQIEKKYIYQFVPDTPYKKVLGLPQNLRS